MVKKVKGELKEVMGVYPDSTECSIGQRTPSRRPLHQEIDRC